ncbi:hypothetical protein DFO77_109170 [Marinilabilia salmonicolor]|jgi:hypothetical protein|uniref:DUF5916 domain-containing protein n=1 Tax=Marinilabilia salmonicolor TaxID=989 RepID=A0A2T0XTQ8_9BACT|nr:hypothetical protein BY457_101273 [Marinilabilia salmonicolor]RCW36206.1 hypothetical protein DFO77_109170 [Marinilabilia salmonicolor]
MALAFNNALSMRLRGRHYWSSVNNQEYYLLSEDGSLTSYGDMLRMPRLPYHRFVANSFNFILVFAIVFIALSCLFANSGKSLFSQPITIMIVLCVSSSLFKS